MLSKWSEFQIAAVNDGEVMTYEKACIYYIMADMCPVVCDNSREEYVRDQTS